jgi:hypothetical protein
MHPETRDAKGCHLCRQFVDLAGMARTRRLGSGGPSRLSRIAALPHAAYHAACGSYTVSSDALTPVAS